MARFGCSKVAIVSLLFAAPVVAQATPIKVDTVYVQSRVSPTTAGILEFMIPTAGFAYAHDWKRGLLPNLARVLSVVGMVRSGDVILNDVCENECKVFQATLVAATIWATIGAVRTANAYNSSAAQPRVSAYWAPMPSGRWVLGLRVAP